MKEALMRLTIDGVKNNVRYLQRIIAHSAFVQGNTTTAFLTQYEKELLAIPEEAFDQALACAAYFLSSVNETSSEEKKNTEAHSTEVSTWKRRALPK
jgi:acetyl/propionyl-CoA carboxylase alpha subunit